MMKGELSWCWGRQIAWIADSLSLPRMCWQETISSTWPLWPIFSTCTRPWTDPPAMALIMQLRVSCIILCECAKHMPKERCYVCSLGPFRILERILTACDKWCCIIFASHMSSHPVWNTNQKNKKDTQTARSMKVFIIHC